MPATLLLYWMMSQPEVRAVAPELFDYALNVARFKRVRGLIVGYGVPFERYYRQDQPTTHVMMFGGNAMDESHRMYHTNTAGRVAVPPDERENFHVQFYERMRSAGEFDERFAVVEMKAPLDAQRLVLDVDFKVSENGSIAGCEASIAGMQARIHACLTAQFPAHRVEVWHKMGAWRMNTKHGPARPLLRAGVHFYTNVVVTPVVLRYLGDLLRQSVALPPGAELDDVSFSGTGMRMDGSHKITRCPFLEDVRRTHDCRVCHGRRVLLIAPPYALDDTYAAWRKTLLCPLPGEEPWTLPDEVMALLSRKRVVMSSVLEAGRKVHLAASSAAVDPRLVDAQFGTKVYLDQRECGALRKAMQSEFGQFGAITRVFKDGRGNYFFSTTHRFCPFKRGEHSSSTLYIFCDALTQRASLRCRHPNGGDNDPYPCGKGGLDSRMLLQLSTGLKEKLFGAGVRTSDGALGTWDF